MEFSSGTLHLIYRSLIRYRKILLIVTGGVETDLTMDILTTAQQVKRVLNDTYGVRIIKS